MCGGGLAAKSCPTLATLWTAAHQAPLSMGFPRQEYWNGLPFPFSGDLLDPGIEPTYPALQVDSLPTEPPGKSQGSLVANLNAFQGSSMLGQSVKPQWELGMVGPEMNW